MSAEQPVALVLGAGRRRGIGAAVAQRLQRDGARVVVADVPSASEMDDVVADLGGAQQALALSFDARDEGSVVGLFDEVRAAHGRLDTLIYSAGVGDVIAPLSELEAERFDMVIAINLRGAFLAFREAARMFAATPPLGPRGADAEHAPRGGRIVAVASIGGRRGSPMLGAYNASKHGLIGLVRSTAAELALHGTTVNAVCPNHITTDMGAAQNALLSDLGGLPLEDYRTQMRERIPMRRFATVHDVAAACAFLTSDDAAFITGAALDINGGEFMS